MLYSNANWIRTYAGKMDLPLRKAFIGCYRNSKVMPCFLHGIISKIRFRFKKLPVIIRCTEDINSEYFRGIRTLRVTGKLKKQKLDSVNSFKARLPYSKVQKLLESEDVKYIYLDRQYKALLDTASLALNTAAVWKSGFTGKGITAAVVDTGIYPHDDLVKPVNRILAFKDFVKNRTKPYDDNGHGTHVSGDIASNGLSSRGTYKAPAYESSLVGVKVLDKLGSGNLSTIISGIEWCIQNKANYNIRLMCLSLGAEAQSPYKDDLLCEAVEQAWKAGITVCAAAGNEGPDRGTISSPGIDPVIITVGAADDRNTAARADDSVADFSSRGPTVDNLDKPDIVCPGVNIISLRSPGSNLDKKASNSRIDNYYTSMSGTSMATPMCCSCAALLLQKNPSLTPDEVKKIIMASAETMAADKFIEGKGSLDVSKMLSYALPLNRRQRTALAEQKNANPLLPESEGRCRNTR